MVTKGINSNVSSVPNDDSEKYSDDDLMFKNLSNGAGD